MDVAALAANSGVEALINKLDGKAELIPIQSERPRKIAHPQHRGDVRKALRVRQEAGLGRYRSGD
jgi:hypothetical protein